MSETSEFEARARLWAENNGFTFLHIDKNREAVMRRLSDGYEIAVHMHLLHQIMCDEGY